MLHSSIKVLSFAFGLFNFFGGLIAISAGGEAVEVGRARDLPGERRRAATS